MNNMLRMIVTLLIISLLSGAVLAFTYETVEPRIKANEQIAIENALSEIFPEADSFNEKYDNGLEYYEAYKGDNYLGVAGLFSQGGYNDDITFFLGLNKDGKIEGIRIINHVETPGLGARITEDWFLDQFENLESSDPIMVSNDIDSIAGATISAEAVAAGARDGLRRASALLEQEKSEEMSIELIPDGIYEGSGSGARSEIVVAVEIEDGEIIDVRIVEHGDREDMIENSIKGVREQVLEKQSADIDAVTGATQSSMGVIDAVQGALNKASN